MKLHHFLFIWVALTFGSNVIAADDSFLEKVDLANKIADDFAFAMEISVSKSTEKAMTQKISGYVSVMSTGDVKSLIHFDAPDDVRGRKMLIEESYIWAAFPRTRNLVRLSPLQILLGDVAYGDVLRVVYNQSYYLKSKQELEIESVKHYLLHLELKPEKKGAGYQAITLLVNDELLLQRAEIFGSAGKLMKTAFFSDPEMVFGKKINTTVKIESAITKGAVSVLHYLRFKDQKLPSQSYNKNALNRLDLSEI